MAGLPVPDYVQGRSLLPILTGEASPDHHRDFVRCEYFDALDPDLSRKVSGPFGRVYAANIDRPDSVSFPDGVGTFATMYRDRRYKLVIYHGHGLGELYDLEEDPWEHNNLWDDPGHRSIKNRLVFAAFDAHVLLTTDVGSRRIAPM